MKKIILVSVALSLYVSVSFGQVFIGSRQAGMGGAGVASAVGLNAVAYNPAGMLEGPSGEFLLSLGGSSQNLDQISQSVASFSDPAQFMVDNYGKKLDASGNLSGLLGINFNHLGISFLLPSATAALSKPANSVTGTASVLGSGALILTLGQKYSIPGLPIGEIAIGANLKGLGTNYGALTILGDPAAGSPVTATQTVVQGSGYGFDLGAKASYNIPMITDFSVGVVMQNLAQSVTYKPKTRTDTYTFTGAGSAPTVTKGSETEGAQTTANSPTTTVLGCAGTVPGVGLKFAADIASTSGGSGLFTAASESTTHLGIEYPLLLNMLVLRAGTASSPSVSFTTLGAKINVPFLTLEISNVIDNKNSKNTSYTVDAGLAF